MSDTQNTEKAGPKTLLYVFGVVVLIVVALVFLNSEKKSNGSDNKQVTSSNDKIPKIVFQVFDKWNLKPTKTKIKIIKTHQENERISFKEWILHTNEKLAPTGKVLRFPSILDDFKRKLPNEDFSKMKDSWTYSQIDIAKMSYNVFVAVTINGTYITIQEIEKQH